MTTKFIENVKDNSPSKTGTKLVENKVDASPSKTGVKFVKNVEDKRNQMVLYRVPKKRGFWRKVGNALKTTLTDPVSLLGDNEYWIAHFYFSKFPDNSSTSAVPPDRGDKLKWNYGVVKEYRDSTWFLQNTGIRIPIADCILLTNGVNYDKFSAPVWVPKGLGDKLDDTIDGAYAKEKKNNCTTANYSMDPIEYIESTCLQKIFDKFKGR